MSIPKSTVVLMLCKLCIILASFNISNAVGYLSIIYIIHSLALEVRISSLLVSVKADLAMLIFLARRNLAKKE